MEMFLVFILGIILGSSGRQSEDIIFDAPMPQIPNKNTECSDLYRQVVNNRLKRNW